MRDGDHTVSGSTAAVRHGPCLVQIVMHRIDAEFVEVEPSSDGVHIGAIHIDQSADCVNAFGHHAEVCFEDARSVRVCAHHATNA